MRAFVLPSVSQEQIVLVVSASSDQASCSAQAVTGRGDHVNPRIDDLFEEVEVDFAEPELVRQTPVAQEKKAPCLLKLSNVSVVLVTGEYPGRRSAAVFYCSDVQQE